jgi:hypothetical protein
VFCSGGVPSESAGRLCWDRRTRQGGQVGGRAGRWAAFIESPGYAEWLLGMDGGEPSGWDGWPCRCVEPSGAAKRISHVGKPRKYAR